MAAAMSVTPDQPPETKQVFEIFAFDDVLSRPPKEFLIEGLIGHGDTAMLYGPPKSKKTLIVLDLIASLIKGEQFANWFKVKKPAHVLYCYGEGQGGMPNRLVALANKWKFTDAERSRIKFLPLAPGLFDTKDERHIQHLTEYLESLSSKYSGWLNRGLLIIDTFARATRGGDENSTRDMALMIDAFDAAKNRLGCAGLLNHHENRSGRMRGNSALPGALDAFFRTIPNDKTSGRFEYDEAKDQGEFPALGWELKIHSWPGDEGSTHSGPYIEWTGKVDSNQTEKKGDWKESATAALRTYCRGANNAKTIPKIISLMSCSVTPKTLSPHLHECKDSPSSVIQGIYKASTKLDGKAGVEAWHFYWDDTEEGE